MGDEMNWRAICIVCVIGIMAASMIASLPVKAATLSLSSSPSQADLGEQITYTLRITNDGSDSVYVEEVWVHFDWEEDNLAYQISDTYEIIPSGDSFTYQMTITIPGSGITTNIQHNIEARITSADPDGAGGWGTSSTNTYTSTILINEPSSDDEGEDTPGFEMPVILIAAIVGVGAFTVLRRRM